ncbi:MAG: ComEC/Rec2 family competence protein, partial [Flavobacteriales bacterium]
LVGVICASFLPEFAQVNTRVLTWSGVGAGSVSLLLLVVTTRFRESHWFGLWLWPVLVGLGGFLSLSVSDSIFPDSLSGEAFDGKPRAYMAIISDEPQVKNKSVKVTAELSTVNNSSHGKVLLYFKKDSASEGLKYGEQILVRTKLERVKGMGNPNEFNYTRYLRFHNISYRGYVKTGAWSSLSEGSPGLKGWFLDVRSILIGLLKESGLDGNELSVASALILGFRTDLDKELMSAYAGAGATHVLAVSGLHVGIVYMILNFLLRFLNRFRYGKLIRTFLLVTFLFSYAALTGLSASVFRAATMFSFVAVGSALTRNTNIFNTLAASAFVLILYEPMIIMQVGFQLSYAAVIGIVLIQPRLFNLYVFNNRFADWAWSITCVSVAAQIATFPLGLLYFHQFPNLFLVSNLLVIPAAAGILYLGFSLFIASLWKPALLFFGFLLKWLIKCLNKVVVWIEQIPNSVLSGIDISTMEALIIYVLIGSVLVFIILEKRQGIYAAISLSILFMLLQVKEVHSQKTQRFTSIYNVKGETAIALVNGTELTFLASADMLQNEQAILFHVRHHWWNKGIETERFVELNDSVLNHQLSLGNFNLSVLSLQEEQHQKLKLNTEKLDLIVVTDFSDGNNILINHERKTPIVFSSAVSSYRLGKTVTDKYLEANWMAVSNEGAVTIDF